jgi:hypothetical protein
MITENALEVAKNFGRQAERIRSLRVKLEMLAEKTGMVVILVHCSSVGEVVISIDTLISALDRELALAEHDFNDLLKKNVESHWDHLAKLWGQ